MTLKRIKGFLSNPIPDLTPEKEEELIDRIAKKILNLGMEAPAYLFGSAAIPMSPVLSYMVLLPAAPFLELLGISAYEYVELFSKRENMKRLVAKIEKDRY